MEAYLIREAIILMRGALILMRKVIHCSRISKYGSYMEAYVSSRTTTSMKEAIMLMREVIGSVRVFVNDDTDGAVDGVALYGLERNALRHRTWPRQAVWRTKVDHAP